MLKDYVQLPRAVYVLCLGMLINRAGTFLVPFLTLYLTAELGLSREFATTAMGAFGFGAIFAALTGGHFADTIGRRAVMMFALVGGAGVLLVMSMIQAAFGILACLVAFGFVSEMYRPAASAMIADLVPSHRRAHAYGLMYLSINLGFAVAPLIGGLLTRISYSLIFWGDAATACAYAMILLFCVRDTRPNEVQTAASLQSGETQAIGSSSLNAGSFIAALRHLVRDRTMMVFCLAMFFLACVFMQSMSTFPLFLQGKGFDAEAYGHVISVNGIMIVLLQVPVTAIVTRYNRAWIMVLSAVIMSLGFGLIAFGDSKSYFMMTVIVWTLAEMMQVPFASAIVSDLAPLHLRARYMGLLSMSFAIALFVGTPLAGWVLVAFGGMWLWCGTAALAMLSALLLFLIRRAVQGSPSRGNTV